MQLFFSKKKVAQEPTFKNKIKPIDTLLPLSQILRLLQFLTEYHCKNYRNCDSDDSPNHRKPVSTHLLSDIRLPSVLFNKQRSSPSDEVIGEHPLLLFFVFRVGHYKPHLKLDIATSVFASQFLKRQRRMTHMFLRHKSRQGTIYLVCKSALYIDLYLFVFLQYRKLYHIFELTAAQ